MNQCTFIIPTMGRQTLERAVSSLILQNVPNWKALIVFDGNYDVNYVATDDRIKIVKADVGGHAGLVRNYGINMVDTDWIAFLDDDDWLESTYMQKLRGYSDSHPEWDLVIFTYKDVVNNVTIPDKKLKKIEECKVGISFAVKTEFVNKNNIRFTPNAIEDFRFLDLCETNGAKYFISHDLQYYVGGRGGWLRKD